MSLVLGIGPSCSSQNQGLVQAMEPRFVAQDYPAVGIVSQLNSGYDDQLRPSFAARPVYAIPTSSLSPRLRGPL